MIDYSDKMEIEKYLEDNNLEVEEVIYMDNNGYQLWQLCPSGGLLLHNDQIISYITQLQLDNWEKDKIVLNCSKFNKD